MNERARILSLLSDGKITVDEAEKLLDALKERENSTIDAVEFKGKRGRKHTKLRVNIDSGENSKKAKVNVSIPISLIRTLGPAIVNNLPKDTREDLNKSGVDIVRIIDEIDELIAENSDEDIVNIDTDGDEKAKVRIYLE